eukprot:TRINITY_DN37987_c0_g1_i2.p2 TRINITY_DN37987_c0_g1~~TRINITY_DN37987_c0_g1_i2.p2  ORF type:complete len:229 (+),score=23.60 TRINITY_DN37987_c0_g1_i2:355-1041(+)
MAMSRSCDPGELAKARLTDIGRLLLDIIRNGWSGVARTRQDGSQDASSACWLWQGGDDAWRPLPAYPHGVAHHGAVAWEDGVLVAGGGATAKKPMSTVHYLDIGRGDWISWKDLPEAVSYHGLVVAADGRLVLAGGHGDQKLFSCVWALDPREGTWALLPGRLPGPRWAHGLATTEHGIAAIGGYGAYGSRYRMRYLDSVTLFDARSGSISAQCSLNQARAKVAAVSI